MSELTVTLIDVGWGDSILIESVDANHVSRFALVDCNDYETERSSHVFVKRLFQRRDIDFENTLRNFDWVLLTHGHADHARGMKRMLETYGTRQFWYPKSVPSTSYGTLIRFANRSSRIEHHQAIDATKVLPAFGAVSLQVLWPEYDVIDGDNENNNSVVLALTLGGVTFVLTGDAEASNWPAINPRIPATTRVFQSPHHGAQNGMFDEQGAASWLGSLPAGTVVAISCHLKPHGHPHPDVIHELEARGVEHFRTDRQYHLVFRTDGAGVTREFTHLG